LDIQEKVIVSGLPQSGTALVMQMLEAGGMECFKDFINPAQKNSTEYNSILEHTGNKAVEITASNLLYLPDNYQYKIIFVERELIENVMSHHKEIRRYKREAEEFPMQLWEEFKQVLVRVKAYIDRHPNIDSLTLNHHEILNDPISAAIEIVVFLNRDMDINRMHSIVNSDLNHYRRKRKDL
jgi:hypothetical protein